jgi:hypothetical protein
MANLYIFGNSHVSNYAASLEYYGNPYTLKWRSFNSASPEPFYGNIKLKEITFSWLIPSAAWTIVEDASILEKMSEGFDIQEDDIVIVHWGDQDILKHLPGHKNEMYLVRAYINRIKDHFKCRVIFLEPVPIPEESFVCPIEDYKFVYSREDIIEAYDNFVKILREGTETISIQNNIISSFNLTENETDDGAHLNQEYSRSLIAHIRGILDV